MLCMRSVWQTATNSVSVRCQTPTPMGAYNRESKQEGPPFIYAAISFFFCLCSLKMTEFCVPACLTSLVVDMGAVFVPL